jgi:membrane-bound ClpP family serine protease
MCHLLLLLPVLALPVFWLWPPAISVPVYAAIVTLSLSVYGMVLKAMHRPVETGKEGILHATGVVVSDAGEPLVVRIESELWDATCADRQLRRGDRVRVVGIEGLTLRVIRAPEREESGAGRGIPS